MKTDVILIQLNYTNYVQYYKHDLDCYRYANASYTMAWYEAMGMSEWVSEWLSLTTFQGH